MTLGVKVDDRGELAEFVKQTGFGQIFVTRTRPGKTRGNHYHKHKREKFLVVEGSGVIRLRQQATTVVSELLVRGKDFRVVNIFPGTVHSFENVGETDLVVVIWANEVFDPKNPDTYSEDVCASAQLSVQDRK